MLTAMVRMKGRKKIFGSLPSRQRFFGELIQRAVIVSNEMSGKVSFKERLENANISDLFFGQENQL